MHVCIVYHAFLFNLTNLYLYPFLPKAHLGNLQPLIRWSHLQLSKYPDHRNLSPNFC